MRRAVLTLVLLLAACTAAPPLSPGLTPVTAIPTLDSSNPEVLCAAVDAAWGRDWPRAIHALEALAGLDEACADGQPATFKLYVAHYNYGRALADAGLTAEAVGQYEAALTLNPDGVEAMEALRALGVFTPQPLAACSAADIDAAMAALPPYEPSDVDAFVTVASDRFQVGDELFLVRGVNYYPLRYPWRRFLTEANLEEVRFELALLQDTGFNTLRLFLWHEALFTCPGSGAVPVPEAFERLDATVHMAAELGLRLILTLNDLPDLTAYPLYTAPEHSIAQITFLVERYRDEAAILAWDLRNEGDVDYWPVGDLGGGFARDDVLNWLGETAALVRAHDERHLITAGWLRDAEATIPYVDFVSFHHWEEAQRLRERVLALRGYTDKPIVLEEVGYSTYLMDEVAQGRLLREAIQAAEYDGLAGWLIWTAFDFPPAVACDPPACPAADGPELHFGLWNGDYTPKMALSVVRVLAQSAYRQP